MILLVLLVVRETSPQGISGALRIQDGAATQLLRITHYGRVLVTIFNDPEYFGVDRSMTISHIGSTVHVSGRVILSSVAGTAVTVTGTALDVNCTGCAAASVVEVDHVSSVTHIAGAVSLVSRAGIYATLTSTSLDVNCTAGCAGGSSDSVNVFHQSTVRHISSVTHVAGGVSVVARDGTYATLTGSSLNVNLTNTPAVSQSGEWNVRHISTAVHLAGNVTDNANSALRVTGVTVFEIQGAVGHISSQVHMAGTVRMAQHVAGGVTFGAVANCGTTARTVIATNVNRRSIILQNAGDNLLYIGGTHATITAANGFPLHASAATQNPQNWHAVLSRVELPFYRGPIACLAAAGNSGLRYIEILDPGGAPKSGF